jgi:hypothetical protein
VEQPNNKHNNTMSLTLAELNEKAQEIANKLGHIEQELLLEIHALLHKNDKPKLEVVPPTSASTK